MIEVKDISKSFGKQNILKNINVTIKKGEMFGLLGPSGAGKTTLIRLITGAETVDKGEILVDNRPVPNFQTLKTIGFMPQNDGLYPEISGYDNLHFFGGLFGLRGKVLEDSIVKVLQLVDLTGDAKKMVEKYSGGMKKRLSLAAALIHCPEVLILDEPTVGIDPLLRRKIWEEFKHQQSIGKTIIVTTHVMDEIKYCDRAGLIYEGHLIACDTVDKLIELGEGSIENLFFNVPLGERG
ncbi:ABC transporter ATP-binding protein [Clostridium sp.]|uniref:ABC transporter ATP-binding protein n=1 Tax=Clostridium sp. TaxID=1506 RepID=UPI002FCABD2A